MNLRKFLEKLNTYDPELTVKLADWNEGYALDSEDSAEKMCVAKDQSGRDYLLIGEDQSDFWAPRSGIG